jgi:hypothetical protein
MIVSIAVALRVCHFHFPIIYSYVPFTYILFFDTVPMVQTILHSNICTIRNMYGTIPLFSARHSPCSAPVQILFKIISKISIALTTINNLLIIFIRTILLKCYCPFFHFFCLFAGHHWRG